MNAEDDDLSRELHRLFSDSRLDLRPRAGAENTLVAGARRVRSRRTALAGTSGAIVALLLAGGGIALGGMRTGPEPAALPPAAGPAPSTSGPASSVQSAPPSLPETISPGPDMPGHPASAPPPSVRSSPTSTAPPGSSSSAVRLAPAYGPVLGPTGYGRLQLGMSFEAAKATGMLTGADNPPTDCTTYSLSDGASGVSAVRISPTDGLLEFEAGGAHTPENIKVGSTLAQLKAAYHDLAKGSATYTAPTGSGGSYVFYLNDNDVVTAFQLIGSVVTC